MKCQKFVPLCKTRKLTQQKFLHFEGIEFADFCEGPEAEIDVLIGMDNYWKLVTGNVIKSG